MPVSLAEEQVQVMFEQGEIAPTKIEMKRVEEKAVGTRVRELRQELRLTVAEVAWGFESLRLDNDMEKENR